MTSGVQDCYASVTPLTPAFTTFNVENAQQMKESLFVLNRLTIEFGIYQVGT